MESETKKEIWLVISVSTFDNWRTKQKDVILAESTKEQAKITCEQFEERRKEENNILKDFDVYYIYQKINLYY